MQFNTEQEISKAARGFLKVLKLPLHNHPRIIGKVCVIPYDGLVRHEIERAAKKIGYKVWKYNKQILIFKGGLAPILLLDNTLVLLGISVPEWQFFTSSKPIIKDTDNGFLGVLKPKKDDLEDHRDYIDSELKEKNGFLYQPCIGLEKAKEFDKLYLEDTKDIKTRENTEKAEYKLKPVFKDLNKSVVEAIYHADSTFSRPTMLKLLELAWEDLNKVKFNNELNKPKFKMMNDMGHSKLYTRGAYYPFLKIIAISPRIFNGDVNNFFTVLLHEMCHQATHEISNDHSYEDQGHGPTWRNWMEKVGLPPARYDDVPNSGYMTNNEKYVKDKVKGYVDSHLLKPSDIRQGMLCGVYEPYDNTIREGLIVKVFEDACFLSMPAKSSISRAPFKYLCTLPKYTIDKKYPKRLADTLRYYEYSGPILKPEQ